MSAVLQLHAYEPLFKVVAYVCWHVKCASDSIVHTSGERGSIQTSRTILQDFINWCTALKKALCGLSGLRVNGVC